MDNSNIFATLGQVSSGEAGIIFRNFLRGSVRQLICEVMASEVSELCGHKFVDEFRSRDISRQNWVGLMLDGIRLIGQRHFPQPFGR